MKKRRIGIICLFAMCAPLVLLAAADNADARQPRAINTTIGEIYRVSHARNLIHVNVEGDVYVVHLNEDTVYAVNGWDARKRYVLRRGNTVRVTVIGYDAIQIDWLEYRDRPEPKAQGPLIREPIVRF